LGVIHKRVGRFVLAERKAHSVDQQKMLTLRKKIAEVLEAEYLDLREISKLFGMKERGP